MGMRGIRVGMGEWGGVCGEMMGMQAIMVGMQEIMVEMWGSEWECGESGGNVENA